MSRSAAGASRIHRATARRAEQRIFPDLPRRAKPEALSRPFCELQDIVAREQRTKVEVPGPDQDRPNLGRVGIVAVVGFLIGIAWPWLAGVQLVPSVPGESAPAQTQKPVASAAPSTPPAAKTAAAPKPKAEPKPVERIKIGDAKVTSCRDANGDKLGKCDALTVDRMAQARIRALGTCKGAENAHGMLSLGLELDFKQKKVSRIMRGMSTTLPEGITDTLLRCARKEFAAASLEGIQHKHSEYKVFYPVEFLPPGEAPSDEESEAESADTMTAASGVATVSWNVALIRDAPNQDGKRIARILSGTRVTVLGRKGDWYKVKYDAKGNEGWVYKSAIGL